LKHIRAGVGLQMILQKMKVTGKAVEMCSIDCITWCTNTLSISIVTKRKEQIIYQSSNLEIKSGKYWQIAYIPKAVVYKSSTSKKNSFWLT
jgi:hypothetical protein